MTNNNFNMLDTYKIDIQSYFTKELTKADNEQLLVIKKAFEDALDKVIEQRMELESKQFNLDNNHFNKIPDVPIKDRTIINKAQ